MTPKQQTQVADQSTDLDIPCVTQDPIEPAAQMYLDVCTGSADLIAVSRYCTASGDPCGGHPICRPCYELARAEGLVQ